MRIGINASFLRKSATGIGQVTTHFIRTLVSRYVGGEHEFFLYMEEDPLIALPEHFHVRSFLPPWKRDDLVRKVLWERFLLPRMVAEDRCDVMISMYQSATILSKNCLHIMVVHDLIPRLFPIYCDNLRKKTYRALVERGIAAADKVVAISKRTEKDLIRILAIPAEKITVSYLAIDPIFYVNVSGQRSSAVLKKYHLSPGYIYAGGGMDMRKNMEGVLRGYDILREQAYHAKGKIPPLVLSGALSPQLAPLVTDVERRVREMNLTPYVHILGHVPQEDLPSLYANAIFFVYPSLYEGFGMPVLEAMSVGTPVIASKKSSLPEVGGDSVLYCDPTSAHDIAMVMGNLLRKKELRDVLAQRSKERVRRFSWDAFTEKIFAITAQKKQRREMK